MPRKKTEIHPVDSYVGKQLKSLRLLKGMSQSELAKSVDLTFQQIQKYERGINRVSASRLYEFGRVFRVPFEFFLKGFNDKRRRPLYAVEGMSDNGQATFTEENTEDVMHSRETLSLIRAYYSIPDVKLRKQLLEMAKTMGAQK